MEFSTVIANDVRDIGVSTLSEATQQYLQLKGSQRQVPLAGCLAISSAAH